MNVSQEAIKNALISIAVDGAGAVAADMVLGNILPDGNPMLDALGGGIIATAGSYGARTLVFGQPLPTNLISVADDIAFNSGFQAASQMAGTTDAVARMSAQIGLGGNLMIQSAIISGAVTSGGNFVRDTFRSMWGGSLITDPIASLLGNAAKSTGGLALA